MTNLYDESSCTHLLAGYMPLMTEPLPNDCKSCGSAPAIEDEPLCLSCAIERDADDHHSECDCDACWRRAHASTSAVRPRGISRFGREVLGWCDEEGAP